VVEPIKSGVIDHAILTEIVDSFSAPPRTETIIVLRCRYPDRTWLLIDELEDATNVTAGFDVGRTVTRL
jgi:hypothetical protein